MPSYHKVRAARARRIGTALSASLTMLLPVFLAPETGLCQVPDTARAGRADSAVIDALRRRLDERGRARRPPTRVLQLVQAMPVDGTRESLRQQLPALLAEIDRTTHAELGLVREALTLLRQRHNIVVALAAHYESIPRNSFHARLRSLEVLGELQRTDALAPLRRIVRQPLPARARGGAEGMTEREYEEMIQSKAVHGIAFIRTETGELDSTAMAEVRTVMRQHASRAVRVAAIDAYMWNHHDRSAAAIELYRILPSEYHRYVERPRFQRGNPPELFRRQLQTWRDKWKQ